MMMFEQICKAYIKKDLEFRGSFEMLSKYISFSMVRGGLEDSHAKRGYKHFCFSGFRQKKDEISYKAGETYEFVIRSFDESFLDSLAKALRENIDNPCMLVVQTTKKKLKQYFISELYSATPVIVSCKDTDSEHSYFWTVEKNGDIMQLQKQLHDNLEKKYQTYFGEKLKAEQNFIQLLELKNRVPQNIEIQKEGKKIRFFGNKFRIIPNEDELSQKLAFTALACGLGEKNSYGGGFLLGKGIR
ncbi:MAG: CRISPR-associated endoribonuclease Cas6 [Campylobacterales bacterium]|nr:CRISPR-associated endoribonuclease Cas6 [Campylobacterota bacterium]MBD3843648.1 CRISPR-associated endoribonuclease Cas6 [Campylobacterales bacterium]